MQKKYRILLRPQHDGLELPGHREKEGKAVFPGEV